MREEHKKTTTAEVSQCQVNQISKRASARRVFRGRVSRFDIIIQVGVIAVNSAAATADTALRLASQARQRKSKFKLKLVVGGRSR